MEKLENQDSEYVVLSKAEIMFMQHEAAKIGAKVALDRLEQEKKKIYNRSIDRRLHNTKLLLRNYHMLKLNMSNSIYGRSQMDESATDILSGMMNLYDDEVIVDAIKRSATRTSIIVSHIESMIELYKIYCEKSNNDLDQRRYEVLFDMYLADEILKVKDIAKKQCMSTDNVYCDLKIAIEKISALIFGIEGLKIL